MLWVGHLNANKDPLTILEAVSIARRRLPGLQLWFCFGSAPMHQAVEARIAREVELRECVHLLGRVPHEQVETLMRAADLFVLGSHREGSSFSLIEALATGLTPVVSAIPSLRVLTGNGAVGALFPCGDARALSDAAAGRRSRAGTADARSHARALRLDSCRAPLSGGSSSGLTLPSLRYDRSVSRARAHHERDDQPLFRHRSSRPSRRLLANVVSFASGVALATTIRRGLQ